MARAALRLRFEALAMARASLRAVLRLFAVRAPFRAPKESPLHGEGLPAAPFWSPFKFLDPITEPKVNEKSERAQKNSCRAALAMARAQKRAVLQPSPRRPSDKYDL